jgi:diguanylate cyclase (GGDEF)-like protein
MDAAMFPVRGIVPWLNPVEDRLSVRRSQATNLPMGDYAGALRHAVSRAYAVLRERDTSQQRALICTDLLDLLDASAVRGFELVGGEWQVAGEANSLPLPALAEEMERALLPRALAQNKSLLSSHPRLDPALADLARRCRAAEITTHLTLVRAGQETHGVYATHWIGRERPSYEQRVGFSYYWDTIGIAAAAANERVLLEAEFARLRQRAFWDRLTGLPNALALEDELHAHDQTSPFSVLALDFDGLREANAAFGFVEGGDVLIRSVGQGLRRLVLPREFAARMYTAGDEFAVLLPGAGVELARTRATEIESGLDDLEVPETHRAIYRGASVGFATRRDLDEKPGQTLGRAIETMRERKSVRRAGR